MIDRRSFIKGAGVAMFSMGATSLLAGSSKAKRKPNFVVIFIDDMGYGDIEPFGSKLNKTPQLNRMAAEGMKLTSFYVAAPVCTPSRAALMTGCYPKRVGLATGSWSIVLFPKDAHGLNPTLPAVSENGTSETSPSFCRPTTDSIHTSVFHIRTICGRWNRNRMNGRLLHAPFLSCATTKSWT